MVSAITVRVENPQKPVIKTIFSKPNFILSSCISVSSAKMGGSCYKVTSHYIHSTNISITSLFLTQNSTIPLSFHLFLSIYRKDIHSFSYFCTDQKINKIMYPLKFKPILKSTLWGGERIIPFKQLDCQQEQVGESWEISDVPGDESVVAEGADAGKNLTQLMEEYKGKLVGEENYKRFQGKFPLLIKFIDAKQDLSIQVHPDDELAMKRHQSMGKTEMWYIIDNTGGQAHLYSGLKKQITPQEYADMIENNTICDALDKYDVQPGDVFFLPAGRIHSIGAGCFLAEIQQTSNITYRIYDFNRRDKNGNLRELHTELSKDAIDYTVSDDYRTHYEPRKDEPVELVSCPYFTTSVYNLTETMNMDYSELDSFVIYICMKGACTVTDNEGNRISVKAGESVLFPATTQNLEVVPEGEVSFLETYV